MCQKCFDLAQLQFPDLSDDDIGELLMSATAFPFGSPDYIGNQLRDLAENTDGTLQGAIAYAHQKMNEEFEKLKAAGEI